MTLDEIFNKYNSDKGSLPGGHCYGQYYEKHLPKQISKFLEIGVWKGGGIRAFREWYKEEGMFYGLDRFIDGHGLITPAELQALGINCFDADHDQEWALELIKEQFSVIIDDASHHHLSQINIFRRMFVHNLEPGGLYVIEDVFDDPYWGQGVITDKKQNIKGLLTKFKEESNIVGQLIGEEESDTICSQIKNVYIYENIIFVEKC